MDKLLEIITSQGPLVGILVLGGIGVYKYLINPSMNDLKDRIKNLEAKDAEKDVKISQLQEERLREYKEISQIMNNTLIDHAKLLQEVVRELKELMGGHRFKNNSVKDE